MIEVNLKKRPPKDLAAESQPMIPRSAADDAVVTNRRGGDAKGPAASHHADNAVPPRADGCGAPVDVNVDAVDENGKIATRPSQASIR